MSVVISGRVRNAAGNPIIGADVSLLNSSTQAAVATTTTDTDGKYTFTADQLAAGYDVRAIWGNKVEWRRVDDKQQAQNLVNTLLMASQQVIAGSETGARVVLDALSTNNPFMEVYDATVRRVRLGNLTGITGASGYGLWTDNGFFTGAITSTSGTIGGFTLSASALYAGAVATRIQLDTTSGIHLGATAFADAPFRVSLAGALVATSATITGAITISSGSGYANISDKPTSLGGINSAEGTKLTGIEAGATVGAAWGTNLSGIPGRFGDAPGGAGLYLTATYMGYYNATVWKTYMDNTGKFFLSGTAGYLNWDPVADTLSLKGAITATSGSFTGTITSTSGTIGGWTLDATTLTSTGVILTSTGGITVIPDTTDQGYLRFFKAGDASYIASVYATRNSLDYDASLLALVVKKYDGTAKYTLTLGGSYGLASFSSSIALPTSSQIRWPLGQTASAYITYNGTYLLLYGKPVYLTHSIYLGDQTTRYIYDAGATSGLAVAGGAFSTTGYIYPGTGSALQTTTYIVGGSTMALMGGNVGIGTTAFTGGGSPELNIKASGVGQAAGLGLQSSDGTSSIYLRSGTGSDGQLIGYQNNLQFGVTTGTGTTGYSEKVRITSTGNVGIGVTPGAWGSSFVALQIGQTAALWGHSASNNLYLSTNTYFDGTNWRAIVNSAAVNIELYNAGLIVRTAPSVAAGAVQTFTTRLQINLAGIHTMGAYGAGTATFDANGVISSVSDERLKTNIQSHPYGLKELLSWKPISHHWAKESMLDMIGTYHGFSAQNIQASAPSLVKANRDGWLSYEDKGILATVVVSVQEVHARIAALEGELARLKISLN